MFRAHRFATPAVLVAVGLALATTGCGTVDDDVPVAVIRLQLPSFDEGALEGIWLWRKNEKNGRFRPVSEIRLGTTVVENGVEYVEYELLDRDGNSLQVTLSAAVDRTAGTPELALWVVRFAKPGEFKATVYNAAGESPLSEASVFL